MICFLCFFNIKKCISQKQQWCVVVSSKAHAICFNIFTKVKYDYGKVLIDETILWTSTTNLCKSIKKSHNLSIEKEQRMLAQAMCQPTCNLNFDLDIFACNFYYYKGMFWTP